MENVNYPRPSDFIKAYLNMYSNDVLVNKVKWLYNITEEEIQELINQESLSLDIFLSQQITITNSMEDEIAYQQGH
jgi:hypothetical protein